MFAVTLLLNVHPATFFNHSSCLSTRCGRGSGHCAASSSFLKLRRHLVIPLMFQNRNVVTIQTLRRRILFPKLTSSLALYALVFSDPCTGYLSLLSRSCHGGGDNNLQSYSCHTPIYRGWERDASSKLGVKISCLNTGTTTGRQTVGRRGVFGYCFSLVNAAPWSYMNLRNAFARVPTSNFPAIYRSGKEKYCSCHALRNFQMHFVGPILRFMWSCIVGIACMSHDRLKLLDKWKTYK